VYSIRLRGSGTMAGLEIVSQNACSCSTRRSGGLPAISAALMAPIDMPAIQFGRMPASCRAW